jgi:putative transposase
VAVLIAIITESFLSESTMARQPLCYLALRNITKKWKNPPVTWKLAATQFAIQFGERFFATEAA